MKMKFILGLTLSVFIASCGSRGSTATPTKKRTLQATGASEPKPAPKPSKEEETPGKSKVPQIEQEEEPSRPPQGGGIPDIPTENPTTTSPSPNKTTPGGPIDTNPYR